MGSLPIELPLHHGDVVARILSFHHAGLLPVHASTDPNGNSVLVQEEKPGIALEALLRECSAERAEPWNGIYGDGRCGLVAAFVRVVRLIDALRAADIDVPLPRPRTVETMASAEFGRLASRIRRLLQARGTLD